MPQIDTSTYDKAKTYPAGQGYGRRATAPTSVVIHSTNNKNPNTFFTAEAKFLFESPNVSAHYLVGKAGQIAQFLNPGTKEAWHAGGQQQSGAWTAKPDFSNPRSIGIELHHSIGDPPYPEPQIAALTWLVRELMLKFQIPLSLIDTHRAIALPKGRKVDPSDWTDASFYRWRAQLEGPLIVPYRALHTQAVFEAPDPAARIALAGTAEINAGDTVRVDEVKAGWAHLATHVGFVPIGILEKM